MKLRAAAFVFVAAMLFLGMSAIVIYQLTSMRIAAQDGVAHQLQVVLELDGFLSSLNEAESAERGYLLTEHTSYLDTFTAQVREVRAKLTRLNHLVDTTDLPGDMVRKLAELAERRLSEMEGTISVRSKIGLQSALDVMHGNEERALMLQIESQTADIRSVEERELKDASDRADWAGNLRSQTLVAVCVLNLIFLWWGYRKICSETQKQHRATEDMASLQRVGLQCARASDDFQECLEEILAAAIALTDSDKGTVQLLEGSGGIRLAAHHGFDARNLNGLACVDPNSGCACAQVLRTGERVSVRDLRQCRDDHSWDIIREAGVRAVQCTPLISSSGKVLGIVSTHYMKAHSCSEGQLRLMDLLARQAADYLERKHVEAQLQNANKQLADRAVHLEQLVDERTARLKEMLGDLEALSYSIVHDMRAPLRAMQGFAELLGSECAPIGTTAEHYVERIKIAATRMDHLIRDGLNYNRMMRAELPLTKIDVGRLLRGIVETYPEFQTRDVHIELRGDFPPVHANEAALTQCISSLISNAIKFVDPGIIAVVKICSKTHDSRVRLYFNDNGIGIRKEAHAKIFEIFQRLDQKHEGTGIGLAIVKKAVERMNGKVGLESEPGKGSTFWIELEATEGVEQPFGKSASGCQMQTSYAQA
ncbi:MAG: ATP-binding protein [Limisphaerales bacterium]